MNSFRGSKFSSTRRMQIDSCSVRFVSWSLEMPPHCKCNWICFYHYRNWRVFWQRALWNSHIGCTYRLPLATYVHCSAHCSNLVVAVSSSSGMVRDWVQYVNDFGVMCNLYGNFKALFAKILFNSGNDRNIFSCICSEVASPSSGSTMTA